MSLKKECYDFIIFKKKVILNSYIHPLPPSVQNYVATAAKYTLPQSWYTLRKIISRNF